MLHTSKMEFDPDRLSKLNFLYVQQYFQMTITKILQVCYLTHTDTTKLVDHGENYSWVGGSYQLPVITIKKTQNPKMFPNLSVPR